MKLTLTEQSPFAQGGRRQCYVHPEAVERCVKVRRPDKPLEFLRSQRSFPKNVMPLSSFDDSLQEYQVMKALDEAHGDSLYRHVNHCYGFEDTDMGPGRVCELIRDGDGSVSKSMRDYIIENGYNSDLKKLVDDFSDFWEKSLIPYRGNFRLENLVVQRDEFGQLRRVVVIDDIGYSSSIPQWMMPRSMMMKKAQDKTKELYKRIHRLVKKFRGDEDNSAV